MVHTSLDIFSPANGAQFIEHFGQRAHDDMLASFASVPIAHAKNGERLHYVTAAATEQNSEPAVTAMYIPGYTEGIVAKAAFAGAMAECGVTTILPDQSRSGIVRSSNGKKDATLTQAHNYLAVLEHAELADAPYMHFAAHSYGGPILETMVYEGIRRGYACFNGSVAVMLAPASSGKAEHSAPFAARFAQSARSESGTPKEYKDIDGSMLKAGINNALRNPARTFREALEMKKRLVDYERLQVSGLAGVVILGFANDKLFTPKKLGSKAATNMAAGVTYATPFSADPAMRQRPATHNDDQFNPRRVAGAVAEVIKLHAA